MRPRDLLDRLTFRSKESRARKDLETEKASNLESVRERQAHYRAITQTDAAGKDTRT